VLTFLAAGQPRIPGPQQPAWLLLGLVLVIASQALSAIRWSVIADALGSRRSRPAVVRCYLASSAFSQVLPTGLGGDVIRVGWLAAEIGRSRSLLSVVVDRLSGFVALGAVAAIAATSGSLAALPALCVLLPAGAVRRWAARAFGQDGPLQMGRRLPWRRIWLISLAHVVVVVGAVAALLVGFGSMLPWWELPVGVFAMAVASVMPFAFGGWGIREAAFVGVAASSVDPGPALAASLSFGLGLALAGIAGLGWSTLVRLRP
jgi:uncharacterized membrane protein YbhN (UPF0104 family)